MCGIAGCVGMRVPAALPALPVMLAALRARGPDGEGIWRGADDRVGLAHARLSIVDLAGSPQPMANEDGTVVTTFNGEIYNYRALRTALAARGHRLRSAGDTEVLVHLYEEDGVRLPEALDGMYAFAVYDARRHALLLARDRAGIKPLYYRHDPVTGDLVFASTLGALLADPSTPRTLDEDALAEYLHFGYAVHPRAWLAGVAQLEPGESLWWAGGRVQRLRHHAWSYAPDPALADPGRARDALRATLGASVASHLVADVPLGTFLSGGLDSTLVSGLAQQAVGAARPLRSFTVRNPGPDDETERARAIARELGTQHQAIEPGELPFARETLDALVGHLGEPFGDTSLLNVYLLCARVKPHATVALSGDGGDELFFGYAGMHKQALVRRTRVVPRMLRRTAMLAAAGGGTLPRRVRKVASLSLHDDPGLIVEWARRWEWDDLHRLLGAERVAAHHPRPGELFPSIRDRIERGGAGGFRERQLRFHVLVDLPADCLLKVDRMSMAHGVEVRVPMLANAMLDYGARLPVDAPARAWGSGRTKEPLRTLAEALAPTVAEPAPKRGFSFPLASWLHGPLPAAWRRWAVTDVLATLGFRADAVEGLVADFAVAGEGYARGWLAARLFDLLVLALWAERHGVRAAGAGR